MCGCGSHNQWYTSDQILFFENLKNLQGAEARPGSKICIHFFLEILAHFLKQLWKFKYFVKICNAKRCWDLHALFLIAKGGSPHKLGAERALTYFNNNSLLSNNLLLFIEAKCLLYSYLVLRYQTEIICYVVRGVQGPGEKQL